jgi:hypothetical protein
VHVDILYSLQRRLAVAVECQVPAPAGIVTVSEYWDQCFYTMVIGRSRYGSTQDAVQRFGMPVGPLQYFAGVQQAVVTSANCAVHASVSRGGTSGGAGGADAQLYVYVPLPSACMQISLMSFPIAVVQGLSG